MTSLRYLTVRCTHVPEEYSKNVCRQRGLIHFNCSFAPDVFVYWCIGLCVHRRWSIERHRKNMDFGREGGCGGPYLAAPPTSARVQNRVEFVELARDRSSN